VTRPATPSQTVGPFLHLGFDPMRMDDLARDAAHGRRIVVAGRVLDGDGVAIPDAVLELWQANAAGRYAHPEDDRDLPLDPGFQGFGRIPTDGEGRFRFATVMPGAVPGAGNAMQAPHIVVCLFMRGLLRHLYTRIYFEGEAANASDPVLALIEDEHRRATLVARRAGADGAYSWDIVVQGDGETVFLDL